MNGRYEIQILDSVGEPPDEFICGAITGRHAPSTNAGKKAGEWQSLDVVFRSARYEGRSKVSAARATVFLNGERIHDNVALNRRTTWGFRERSRG